MTNTNFGGRLKFGLGLAILGLVTLSAPAQAQDTVTGNWDGAILVAGQELPFTMTVKEGDGGLEGFLSIPDQGMNSEPLESFSYAEGAVEFVLNVGESTLVSFTGSLSGTEMGGAVTGPLPEGAEWKMTRTGDAQIASVPTLEVVPDALSFVLGEEASLSVTVRDADGNEIEADRIRYFIRGDGGIAVEDGRVEATAGGESTIIVLAQVNDQTIRQDVEAHVAWPAVIEVQLAGLPSEIQEGNSYRIESTVITDGGYVRSDYRPTLRSSNPSVLTVSSTGSLRATGPGSVTISASAEGVEQSWELSVRESPVRAIELTADRDRARTGDVVHVAARALD